ncbi:thiazole synthase [Veillonella sp. R32]|uniref:thiazole synthase n=1 Tax=Veillonella sp. R32 TaxID=2021312 RepID=UPI001389B4AF|nr:thiazole synthase [Veillonella sp. R32]KAF1681857.1 thiazole synthase [Veillonella sp. R32]
MTTTAPANQTDSFTLGPKTFHSRFILGSGKFSLPLIKAVVASGEAEIITLALRRANPEGTENILDFIPPNVTLLPNTSGARTAEEAMRIAELARAMGCGDFIKVEIIRDARWLLPDNDETIRATKLLVAKGFVVLPYMYPDYYATKALEEAGAAAIMPLAAPIGSNRGLCTKPFIDIVLQSTNLPVIVDAGIGKPSEACEAMEMGVSAIMCNTAIATAGDVAQMCAAFKLAIQAGRLGYLAKTGRVLTQQGDASSPLTGFLDN